MNAIIIGAGSEIAREISTRMQANGWHVAGWSRKDSKFLPTMPWDLLLVASGTMEPIGKFFDIDAGDWENCLRVNALDPLRQLRQLWPNRRQGATVCFIGGPNMMKDSPTYSAYRAGKAILESLVNGMIGTLSAEYPGHRFVILHPGIVRTKIHRQSIAAGTRAANLRFAIKIMENATSSVSHDEVYKKFKACIA